MEDLEPLPARISPGFEAGSRQSLSLSLFGAKAQTHEISQRAPLSLILVLLPPPPTTSQSQLPCRAVPCTCLLVPLLLNVTHTFLYKTSAPLM